MLDLVTTREAAAQFRMGIKEFLALPIPFLRLGKRKRRYRQEDLTNFVSQRIMTAPQWQPPKEQKSNGRHVQGKPQEMGLPFNFRQWRKGQVALQMGHTARGRGGL